MLLGKVKSGSSFCRYWFQLIPTQPSTSAGTWGSLAQIWITVFHLPYPCTVSSTGTGMEERGAISTPGIPFSTLWLQLWQVQEQQGGCLTLCAPLHKERQGKKRQAGGTARDCGALTTATACGAGSSLQKKHIRCTLQYLLICRDKEGKGEYGKKEKQPSKNDK